ncbi:leucine-rich_repeat protein [Hexamita inflata]|uniref:Leucine-rich_repeat protein n=1 Tax=Hexamita inflata TaxID=28002 RepID=A0ABP1HGU5_9EUKA
MMTNLNLKVENNNYDQDMIKKYRKKVIKGVLKIEEDQDLKSIEFLQNFQHINKLEINSCSNIIPRLNSKAIQNLSIVYCNVYNIEQFNLENLEILNLHYNLVNTPNAQMQVIKLVQNILKFNKLKELTLYGYQGIEISPLSQMTNLTKLSVGYCNLLNIDALIPLINLIYLDLSGNSGINISPLQHLKQLTHLDLQLCCIQNFNILKLLINLKELNLKINMHPIDFALFPHFPQLSELNLCYCELLNFSVYKPPVSLKKITLMSIKDIDITPLQHWTHPLTGLWLSWCNLKNLDALRPLVNLKHLYIDENYIVSIEPLKELKKLSTLSADHNFIQDIFTLEKHPNFNKFSFHNQQQPTIQQLKIANTLKGINSPITRLRKMSQLKISFGASSINKRQIIHNNMKQLLVEQVSFVSQVAQLFQKLNCIDGYQ